MSHSNLLRPRRLRRSSANRGLMRETRLHPEDLIYPMFVCEGEGKRHPIDTLPGQFRYSIDTLIESCKRNFDLGISTVNLFGYCIDKSEHADAAIDANGLIPRAVRALKDSIPGLCIQTDLALDPYTPHGHDGLVVDGEIVNDPTVNVLCHMALAHARAGVDWVSPSDMMDGRVGAIRRTLDAEGFEQVAILAYSAKYASCFYSPFRGALDSTPGQGDKKTYQMDPANRIEAFKEVQLDVDEGADAVMVKPAGMYLDLVREVRNRVNLPVAAYQVSGEYAMIHAAAEKGWLDRDAAMLESLLCIKRAGADMILTYFAPEAAAALTKNP